MAATFDKYGSQRNNNPDSLGSKLRVVVAADLPWLRTDDVKAMWPDVDGTINVSDADTLNALTGVPVTGNTVLNFVPERITGFGTITKLYYVL